MDSHDIHNQIRKRLPFYIVIGLYGNYLQGMHPDTQEAFDRECGNYISVETPVFNDTIKILDSDAGHCFCYHKGTYYIPAANG